MTGNLIVRETASDFTMHGFNRVNFGDDAIAEINDTIASFTSETPVSYALNQANSAPFAFPSDMFRDLLQSGADVTGQQTGDDDDKKPDAAVTYDCETGACSDGKPPFFTSPMWSALMCKINSQEKLNELQCGNKYDCSRFPDTCETLKTDGGDDPNSRPLGETLGQSIQKSLFDIDLDFKSAGVVLVGIVILAIGLYAFIKS